MPVVSVLMAVKNAQATLERSIFSILNQTFTDFEFIIVDDYSSDKTPAILAEFKEPEIRIVRAEKPGLVNALNHGLNQITGKYIARMDADDKSHPERLKQQVKVLDREPEIGVVSGLVNHISTHKKQEGYAAHVHLINTLISPEEHFANRFRDSPVANPSTMFRKSLLKYGNYKEFDGPEDYEFWLRLMQNGIRFKKIDYQVLDWYDYPDRLTRTSGNYSMEAFSRIKARYFSMWWKVNNRDRELWIWGYGKEVFNKSKWLKEYGIDVTGYIDVKNRSGTTRKVIYYEQIEFKNAFTLVYVSDRLGQQKISNWFENKGLVPISNFYFMT